ncbi:ACP S-malonyltransferase [Candidatus Atelocyanobacterium thalassae]|uniref:Malonyl CoA-acyl carrier protein transacylase n=1 Tax=cyanobacterium endosymbiont of Braarudosphaera bigelowii TaxID=1285375 RepID=A0ABM7UD15_9CHRO|nr:ACP S-malonyltransferase [Candidatus Atelocyanobacterium thalassa]BDA39567.1 malonyl CoA-acyl carrier protein transacylase [cyanobacterium endosymbiont of Braarudosphaera bigelowii]
MVTKTAWIFPGQGSQIVGMGRDLATTDLGKEYFRKAQDILGWSVLEVCQGDTKILSRTLYTQPCLYVIQCILINLLKQNQTNPNFLAGHSLGEYAALHAAEVFDFTTGLQLVKNRAEFMDNVVGGKMVALIKFDRLYLNEIIANVPNVVLANDNSEQQVVISGTPQAVDKVSNSIKAKRVIELKVSGAFHSHLMKEASEQFQVLLENINFEEAQVPVLSNVEAVPRTSKIVLKENLKKQMTGSVRWRETMISMVEHEVIRIVEIGPGKILSNLFKKEYTQITIKNISSLSDF